MPNFSEMFFKTQGKPIKYKGNTLCMADDYPVSNGDTLRICIEKTNSKYTQGVSVDITGSFEMKGTLHKKGKGIRMLVWEDAELIDPKNTEITIFTKKDHVVVNNIWETTSSYLLGTPAGETITKESKTVESWHGGAAMIVEEIENGRRYRCNDGDPDEDFDDIIFTVQTLKAKPS